eukprot:TRINITY_DN1506_c0_g1_i1.p1 TRINITY_DN1506_c0_g1~~TRINITY_DN1506_c0_g1_i1.p1  ORF type:complete len:397 (-),score=61.82 TRINITY_DN1506_c0_g1_i1:206-1396(-)
MVKITEELIRKRAEHNEGILSNLKEVTLHQFDIEKIENLAQLCRHLEILFLQCNLISKIENLSKLKELQYLNLAINNIQRIENLEGCESLNKLDLTCNFISDLLSVESLKGNFNLKELYLVGNPCAQFKDYRKFVVGTLTQLEVLDGTEISRTERLEALQELPDIIKRIEREIKGLGDKNSDSFTPDERLKVYKELQEKRDQKSEPDKKSQESQNSETSNNGSTTANNNKVTETDKIRGMNQGKWEFALTESENGDALLLDLAVGKFLDTSLISLDVQPLYVKIVIKNSVFQLPLPEEVCPDKGNAKRSQMTGNLLVSMPKAKQSVLKKAPTVTQNKQQTGQMENSKVVSIKDIVKKKPPEWSPQLLTPYATTQHNETKKPESTESIDDSEVPPLE